jgi:hypothetical protein
MTSRRAQRRANSQARKSTPPKVAAARAVGRVPSVQLRRDVELLNALSALKAERVSIEAEVTRHVRAARRAGASWERIGAALGVTTQAAQKRWGPYPVGAPRVARRTKADEGGGA